MKKNQRNHINHKYRSSDKKNEKRVQNRAKQRHFGLGKSKNEKGFKTVPNDANL